MHRGSRLFPVDVQHISGDENLIKSFSAATTTKILLLVEAIIQDGLLTAAV